MTSQAQPISEPDFRQLLSRARAGDVEALGNVLNACHGYLSAHARAELNPRWRAKVGASDLVQETLLDGQRDFNRFAGIGLAEMRRWLLQILRNNLLDVVRHHASLKRDATRELPLEAHPVLPDRLIDARSRPSELLQRNERTLAIDLALQRLPVRQQTVILLRHRDGLAFSEIGSRLGVGERMARYLWTQAVSALRIALAESV